MSRWLVLGPVWAWLLLFIALPALIVLALSFSQSAASVPPYNPLLTWDAVVAELCICSADNYATLVADDFYLDAGAAEPAGRVRVIGAVPADRLPDGAWRSHGRRSGGDRCYCCW